MNMAILKLSLLMFCVIMIHYSSSDIIAQVSQAWTRSFDLGHNDRAFASKVDKQGNIIACGYNNVNVIAAYVFLTVKYDSSGNQLWYRNYYGPQWEDEATLLEVDEQGDIYVCGSSYGSQEFMTDICLVKYSSNGDFLWERRFNSSSPYQLETDSAGNVYICGHTYIDGRAHALTLKYDLAGNLQWSRTYQQHSASNNFAMDLETDHKGNVYVTGASMDASSVMKCFVLKYIGIGSLGWTSVFDSSSMVSYTGDEIEILSDGNIVVCGDSYLSSANTVCSILKYGPNGSLIQSRFFDLSESQDGGTFLGVDSLDNCYLSISSNETQGIRILKCDSNGDSIWTKNFKVSSNSFESLYSMFIENDGNIYFTGMYRSASAQFDDCLTARINANGVLQWYRTYSRTKNDVGYSIAVDRRNNVYVAGYSDNNNINSGINDDLLIIKYYQTNPSIKLKVKVLPEGMYYPLFNLLSRRDSVSVYLAESVYPYRIIDSSRSIIDSLSFEANVNFLSAQSGTYYLVIKHFNSIETWSKLGGIELIRGYSIGSYDFTASVLQAYGNNLRLKGGKYCIYAGDINQSSFVDGTDAMRVHSDSRIFLTGSYLPTDLNADGVVDGSDYLLVDNNAYNFVGTVKP